MKRRRTADTAELPEPIDVFGRGAGWVWPAWMATQFDASSPAFVAGVSRNVTGRNWTAIGTIASSHRGAVDPCGLVTPVAGGWSMDWWVGAEDRWHAPSRDRAVRQRRIGGAPVIETSMRIPGGDAVARAYAAVASGVGETIVVEIANESAAPIAVAIAVRPFHPEGLAWVERITLGDDLVVRVDGRPAMLLPRRPAGAVSSTFAGGDVAQRVFANDTPFAMAGDSCAMGLAQAAFVFPVSHRSTLRVGLPLGGSTVPADGPVTLPGSDAAVRAWESHRGRGMRVALPPGRIADAWEAARTRVLLAFDGNGVGAPEQDAPAVLASLERLGFGREAGAVKARAEVVGAAIGCRTPETLTADPAETLDEAVVSALRWHGLSPAATARLAAAEMVAGDARCLDRLRWLLDTASPTWCWPDAVHPRLGTGCDGEGDSVTSAAAVCGLIRDLLVRDLLVRDLSVRDEDPTLVVCSFLPPEWEGHAIEAHDAPTALGRASFAIRWHGSRPALLWEVEPAPGIDRLSVTAPGLDPAWKGEGLRGEALLRT